jgi:hypothetical protein
MLFLLNHILLHQHGQMLKNILVLDLVHDVYYM